MAIEVESWEKRRSIGQRMEISSKSGRNLKRQQRINYIKQTYSLIQSHLVYTCPYPSSNSNSSWATSRSVKSDPNPHCRTLKCTDRRRKTTQRSPRPTKKTRQISCWLYCVTNLIWNGNTIYIPLAIFCKQLISLDDFFNYYILLLASYYYGVIFWLSKFAWSKPVN